MLELSELGLPASPARVQRATLDAMRERTLAKATDFGLIHADPASARRLLAARVEVLTALSYPDADLEQLTLCNDFITCLFHIDDRVDDDDRFGKDPSRLAPYFRGLIAVLRDGHPRSAGEPAARMLLDIRERLVGRASARWLSRFSDNFAAYLIDGALPSAKRWQRGCVAPFEEYAQQRALDSGAFCVQDLLEVAGAGELGAELPLRAEFRALRRLCARVCAFTNDLVSYPKEARAHANPDNLVQVVMHHEGLSFEAALQRVSELIRRDVADFEDVAAALPALDADMAGRVQRYLRGQRAWMGGNLLWSITSSRYLNPDSPFLELRAAKGARATLPYSDGTSVA